MSKLDHYGIRGTALNWFRSYLTNRAQYVYHEHQSSRLKEISHGVPQGSILGPILFLIYINDIVNASNLLKFILFADDTCIFSSAHSLQDLISTTNLELSKVQKWISLNKLTLNINKTHSILFHRNKVLPQIIPDIKIGPDSIKYLDSTKFLGLYIDSQLNWKKHINHINNKLNKQCGIIYLTRHCFNKKALKQIYHSLIYPHLTYCQIVWGATYISTLKPLITTQKRIIRTILGLKRFDHTTEGFANLKLLKLKEINIYCCSIHVFKSITITGDGSFNFRTNQRYSLRENNIMLDVPFVRSQQSKTGILQHGANVWNDLPQNIRHSTSINSFKCKLKKYLISQYIPVLE